MQNNDFIVEKTFNHSPKTDKPSKGPVDTRNKKGEGT